MAEKPTYEELAQKVRELEQAVSAQSVIEAELRELLSGFETFHDKCPLAYQALDENGNFIEVNQAWLEIFGYSMEDVIGKSFSNFLLPGWKNRFKDNFEYFKTTGELVDVEFEMLKKDGSPIFVSIYGKIGRDTEGRFQQTHCIFQDISKRRETEEALHESEEKLRLFIEHAPAALAMFDCKMRYITVSRRWLADYGLQDQDVIGRSHYEIFPEIPDSWKAVHQRGFLGEIVQSEEDEFVREDGSVQWLQWAVRPWYKVDGAVGGIVIFTADLTERKRMEKEREKLHAQLMQAQKMESVGRLAGGIAHDYNNMLSVIFGNTEFALEKVETEDPLHADLQEIMKAAKRSADITRQLLAFARRQTIAPKVINLNETVETTQKMLRRLIGEDIDFSWHPKSNLWPVKVDPTQIDQVLANLCVNARDAISDIGKITIETDTTTFDEAYCAGHAGFVPGDFVMLAVSDDGCGIDKEAMDNIFEPFFTTKEVGFGTGLGLATVFGIVKQNTGFINVYSEPGKGTSVRIYLPRHMGHTVEEQRPGATGIPKGRGETVLLVEDDFSLLKLAERILDSLGYNVLTAKTPSEALKQAETYDGDISLLITDVVMPEMSGRELAERLQNHHPKLECLFMSGYTANVIAHHGILKEGVNFIQKPFSRKDLAIKIRAVID